MKYLVIVFSAALLISCLAAKKPPKAPLPDQVLQAKTVFLMNGGGSSVMNGGSDVAYDAVYGALKSWGRYRLVGSPDQADLIIQVGISAQSSGAYTYTTQNSSSTREEARDVVVIVLIDPKTKDVLWETSRTRPVTLRWMVDKALAKTADSLVEDLKSRVSTPSPLTVP